MTSPDTAQPATEAGRSLLEHMTEDVAGYVVLTSGRFTIEWVLDALRKDIPIIEAQSAAAERAAIREAMYGLISAEVVAGSPGDWMRFEDRMNAILDAREPR